MNIQDFISRQEFSSLLQKAEDRKPFSFNKKCKVSDGTVEVLLYARFIDKELADKYWGGEKYICSLNVRSERTNNQGGWSTPNERKDFIKFSYEDLVRLIERGGHNWCFPENYTYFSDFNEQISMFD